MPTLSLVKASLLKVQLSLAGTGGTNNTDRFLTVGTSDFGVRIDDGTLTYVALAPNIASTTDHRSWSALRGHRARRVDVDGDPDHRLRRPRRRLGQPGRRPGSPDGDALPTPTGAT